MPKKQENQDLGYSITLTPNNRYIVCESSDNTIKLFDIELINGNL